MIIALLLIAVAPVAALPAAHAVPLASCAWVRAENDAAGAGFIVDTQKKWLVTCRHLVADRKKIDVVFPWFRAGTLVTDNGVYLGNRDRLRELGLLVTGKVLKTADEFDLALVELESLPPGAKAVVVARGQPSPGDMLRVVGNRLDLETVFNLSIGPVRVNGRLADGYFWRGRKLATNAPVLIGQLPTDEGDSGGPVFNANGELVGMASALRRQCPEAAVCIAASAIRTFADLPNPLNVNAEKPRASAIAEALKHATVWVRPTATDVRLAGVLIEPDLVLTCGKRLKPGDRIGVAFPVNAGGEWAFEREAFADPLAVQLRGSWRAARVLAHDRNADLALVRLDSPVKHMRPVALAARLPAIGDALHTMNHPGGLEFAWVYAGGAVRQRGQVQVVLGDGAKRTGVLICQLPAQAGSPGGPVLNAQGELVGIMSARESNQQVAYAVNAEEIHVFVDVAALHRPARTIAGLVARIEAAPQWLTRVIAVALATEAEQFRQQGRVTEALKGCYAALELDPNCVLARVVHARMLVPEEALVQLDAAVEKGPFARDVLYWRSELAADAKDWRKARADLERILDVHPHDADARQRLVRVLLELGKNPEAANAVADTLRADPKRLSKVAADLVSHADSLQKKYPEFPSIAAEWLVKALTAANREEFNDLLQQAMNTKADSEKLAMLRSGLVKLAKLREK